MLPSIFLTLPFQSEFQIPQVQIPHPNFPSHPNLRTLTHLSRTPKEIRRPVTGYWAPVRIRLPRRRRCCRAARRRPRSRRLAARARTTATGASRSSSSRRSTTRTPEVHIAGTVDVDVPLHRAGGAPSTAPLVPRAVVRILAPRVRSSSRVWSSWTSTRSSAPGLVVLIVGTVSRTCRDTEEESHAVALSLGLGLERKSARGYLHGEFIRKCRFHQEVSVSSGRK